MQLGTGTPTRAAMAPGLASPVFPPPGLSEQILEIQSAWERQGCHLPGAGEGAGEAERDKHQLHSREHSPPDGAPHCPTQVHMWGQGWGGWSDTVHMGQARAQGAHDREGHRSCSLGKASQPLREGYIWGFPLCSMDVMLSLWNRRMVDCPPP